MDKKININEALNGVTKPFTPRIIGEVDNVYVKLAKVKGDDVPWHSHDNEDEMFYILSGSLVMQQKGVDDITMSEGDLFVVGKGVMHRVYSKDECHLMLVESKESKHTGDVESDITKKVGEQRY